MDELVPSLRPALGVGPRRVNPPPHQRSQHVGQQEQQQREHHKHEHEHEHSNTTMSTNT